MLEGTRILIVEDEPLIALAIELSLRAAGAEIIAVAGTVELALALVETKDIAGAIIDLRLHGRSVRPVLDRLTGRSIPFVFYTGADDARTARGWPRARVVAKPADPAVAVHLLAQLIGR